MKTGGSLSIWFFVGISLVVNGMLICGSGIFELFHPPAEKIVLYESHANIWWGAILGIIGAGYCIYFAPGNGRI
jgi:hypothetical protein